MSATGEWFAEHLEKLEAWAKALIGHADPAVAAVQAEIAKTATELKGDAGHVEAGIKADAATVEHDAEAAAVTIATDVEHEAAPVATEAVKAAETVAGEAVADVAKDI